MLRTILSSALLYFTWSIKDICLILLATVSSFFAPIALMFLSFFTAVLLDMITGIMAAKKRGEKIRSSGLRRTINKLWIYSLVAGTFFLFQQAIIPTIPIINVVFGLVIITELKSITENCDVIFNTCLWGNIYDRVNHIFRRKNKE